jgi:hypothetical protein
MVEPPEPTRLSEPIWLEPYPDVLLEDLADSAPGRTHGTKRERLSDWPS